MAAEFDTDSWIESDEVTSVSDLAALLPAIDAPTRDIVNEWLTRRSRPVFQVGEQLFEIEWLDTIDGALPLVIELHVGAHRALLALDGLASFDPLFVGEPFLLMPEPLRDLAIQRLVARVLASAPVALVEAVDVRAIRWDAPQLPEWNCRLPFALRRHPEGTQLMGCLLVESARGLKWLHETLPIDASSRQARLSVPTPLRLVLGRSLVPSRALHELEIGDVVWIESASVARDGVSVELTAPRERVRWRCRAQRGSLRVTGSAVHLSPASSVVESKSLGVSTMQAQRWQLDVPVSFDLGELHLKTADLELLQPGHLIELEQDVSTISVGLRVGDRIIARGMLVAIGKRLGVRVSAILAQPESET
ncbi:MAG TPA: FliM/FliN family flagellar motor switch protein [Steroidobacter sp.]